MPAPDAVVSLSPNEAIFVAPADLAPHLGELIQTLIELEPRLNVSVELDLARRIREGGSSRRRRNTT